MSAQPVDLVGPHGYTHGWVYHGPGVRGLGGRRHTGRLAAANVRRESAQAGHGRMSASELADRSTRSLTGRKASDYQHLAAARLHSAAARQTTGTRQAHHAKLARMHRGIAARTPGRGTSTEAALRKLAESPRADVRARRAAHKRLAAIGFAGDSAAAELARHQPIDSKIPLGSGGRFKKMKSKLAARGARNPGALAAYIGRRAYGRKKFAALGAHGKAHAHASPAGPALELAMQRYPKLAVTSPYDVMITRGDDGTAVIRHRRGGFEIARLRRDPDGSWVAAIEGRDLPPHTRQRPALIEAIGIHNRQAGTQQHRPQEPAARVQRSEPLQPAPQQTDLMAAYGIPAIRTLANPARSASDGPRVTGSGPSADVAGLSPRGSKIYKKLRGRNFPHARAHAFARRAQNRVAK